jgi:1,4-alpha-glucan branching enzyme
MHRTGSNKHFTLFSDYDIELFKAGKHFRLYNHLGSHIIDDSEIQGVYFSVWAPNAKSVSVIGSFNSWDRKSHPMFPRWDSSGIWELFVDDIIEGELYKYFIETNFGYGIEKGDPYAYSWETPPKTASIIKSISYEWTDNKWINSLNKKVFQKPLSIYEVHLGAWRRHKDDNSFLTYRELSEELSTYCIEMGFTHVELMPVMEHPFYGSWGYQVTGYYAPTSRYGSPEDFMFLVNKLHENNIGIILDWVPSHFPTDAHGPGDFDGTHLYEYEDPQKGFHPDWKSYIFNYGRNEVRAFLISNAMFWLEKYHADGIRVDAVASMLYLDYSRNHGEWQPNIYGGRENLEAVSFLKELNDTIHAYFDQAITIAEESTAWPGVTHSTHSGGLGFDFKWMMGWMHDTLKYFNHDPVHRSYHHSMITFSLYYLYTEHFILPLSHDEVVHGKGSLLTKMPGDDWQMFANLRLLFSYMFCHPGGKLLFMGGEFAQRHEWNHDRSIDWHENNFESHHGIQNLIRHLNSLYLNQPPLYENNYNEEGFEWIDFNDTKNSVLCWIRKAEDKNNSLIIIANFTPVVRENYRIGVPQKGDYEELFNSDHKEFGGSGVCNYGLFTAPISRHGKAQSISLVLPPLGLIILKKLERK